MNESPAPEGASESPVGGLDYDGPPESHDSYGIQSAFPPPRAQERSSSNKTPDSGHQRGPGQPNDSKDDGDTGATQAARSGAEMEGSLSGAFRDAGVRSEDEAVTAWSESSGEEKSADDLHRLTPRMYQLMTSGGKEFRDAQEQAESEYYEAEAKAAEAKGKSINDFRQLPAITQQALTAEQSKYVTPTSEETDPESDKQSQEAHVEEKPAPDARPAAAEEPAPVAAVEAPTPDQTTATQPPGAPKSDTTVESIADTETGATEDNIYVIARDIRDGKMPIPEEIDPVFKLKILNDNIIPKEEFDTLKQNPEGRRYIYSKLALSEETNTTEEEKSASTKEPTGGPDQSRVQQDLEASSPPNVVPAFPQKTLDHLLSEAGKSTPLRDVPTKMQSALVSLGSKNGGYDRSTMDRMADTPQGKLEAYHAFAAAVEAGKIPVEPLEQTLEINQDRQAFLQSSSKTNEANYELSILKKEESQLNAEIESGIGQKLPIESQPKIENALADNSEITSAMAAAAKLHGYSTPEEQREWAAKPLHERQQIAADRRDAINKEQIKNQLGKREKKPGAHDPSQPSTSASSTANIASILNEANGGTPLPTESSTTKNIELSAKDVDALNKLMEEYGRKDGEISVPVSGKRFPKELENAAKALGIENTLLKEKGNEREVWKRVNEAWNKGRFIQETAQVKQKEYDAVKLVVEEYRAKGPESVKSHFDPAIKTALRELGLSKREINQLDKDGKHAEGIQRLSDAMEKGLLVVKEKGGKTKGPPGSAKAQAEEQKLRLVKEAARSGAEKAERFRSGTVETFRSLAEKNPVSRTLFRHATSFLERIGPGNKNIIAYSIGGSFGGSLTVASFFVGPGIELVRVPVVVGLNLLASKGMDSLMNYALSRSFGKFLPDIKVKEMVSRAREALKIADREERGSALSNILRDIAQTNPEKASTEKLIEDAKKIAQEALLSKVLKIGVKYGGFQKSMRDAAAGVSAFSIGSALTTTFITNIIPQDFLSGITVPKPGVPGILKGLPGLEKIPGFGKPEGAPSPSDDGEPPVTQPPDGDGITTEPGGAGEGVGPNGETPGAPDFTQTLNPDSPPADFTGLAEDWERFADQWNGLNEAQRVDFIDFMANGDMQALNNWAEAHAPTPEIIPADAQEILNNPDNFTTVDIAAGDTVGQLFLDNGYNDLGNSIWEANEDNAALFYTTVEANRELLEGMTEKVADAGVATEAFPTEEELLTLAKQAGAGDAAAMHKLTEALHWIPTGDAIKILNSTELAPARNGIGF